MSTDTILEARELSKAFNGFLAVDRVNLSVRRGSIHALTTFSWDSLRADTAAPRNRRSPPAAGASGSTRWRACTYG